jgi:Skp family chaperone for outer membrane proteins
MLAIALGPLSVAAQQQCPPGGIAVIQGPVILASIPRYVARDSEVTMNVEAYKVQIASQQAMLDSLANAYRGKSSLLTASASRIEYQKLKDQGAQIQKRVSDMEKQLGDTRQHLLQPIENGVQMVIDSIRRERKCVMLFDVSSAAAIASLNRSIDVTQVVIDRIRATGDTSIFGPPPKPTADRRP